MKKYWTAAALLMLLAVVPAALSACAAPAASAEAPTKETTTDATTEATETAPSALDAILSAGTTQAFTEDAVPDEDIETILRAGLSAESAINQQPWFFVAVTDKDVLAELSASSGMPRGNMPMPGGERPAMPEGKDMPIPPDGKDFPAMPEGGSMPSMPQGGAKASVGDAPLAIVVYKDENSSSPNPDFDCGLAVQNMYLAAASLGYGAKLVSSPTMTLNGENHDQICEQLGVDPSYTAVAVLLVGTPDESVDGVTGASTRASLEEKTSLR